MSHCVDKQTLPDLLSTACTGWGNINPSSRLGYYFAQTSLLPIWYVWQQRMAYMFVELSGMNCTELTSLQPVMSLRMVHESAPGYCRGQRAIFTNNSYIKWGWPFGELIMVHPAIKLSRQRPEEDNGGMGFADLGLGHVTRQQWR